MNPGKKLTWSFDLELNSGMKLIESVFWCEGVLFKQKGVVGLFVGEDGADFGLFSLLVIFPEGLLWSLSVGLGDIAHLWN